MATEKAPADALPGTANGGHPHPEPTSQVTVGPPAASEPPDLFTILGDLSDAISLVTVVHRSMEAQENAAVGDEEVALRYALTFLHAAYSALDMASSRLTG